ncbi:MAG: proton-conducting transporter membrane subunit [Planctomycetota bacterium]
MTEHINNWIVLPVLLPLIAGILTTLLRPKVMAQRIIGCICIAATAVASLALIITIPTEVGLHLTALGKWPAPFGIAVVFDNISGALVCIASIVALACYVHSFGSLPANVERSWYHPLVHLLLMGVNFSFITGDLFNLFVAFEIMLMASYGLLCVGAERRQISQAYKYIILNLLGSTVFVLSAGLIYGALGTLNYADLARVIRERQMDGTLPAVTDAIAVMLVLVFALKGAVFPLWFWLPDTYHTPPASITALFGALLSKVGIYAILRLHPLLFAPIGGGELNAVQLILPWAAGLTMLIAIVGAIGASEVRRLLAWVLISHVGYLMFGVAVMTQGSMAGTLFYMCQEMLVIAALFLCCSMIEQHAGTGDLREMSGLHQRAPKLSIITFILLMALAGLPPMPGFFAKAMLVREGLATGAWWLVAATLTTAVITLLAVLRLWCHGFWMPPRGPRLVAPPGSSLGASPRLGWQFLATGGLVTATVLLVLLSPQAVGITNDGARMLSEPQRYIQGVLGQDVQQVAEVKP